MEIKEMQQDDLFKLISIYKRMSDQELTEYVCLHNLEMELYAVLCANFFNPSSSNEDHTYFKKLTIELLLEESPLTRCEWFSSIKQAIDQHDLEFS